MKLAWKIALLPLAGISTNALGVDWAFVIKSQSGSLYYIDFDTVEWQENVVTYWEKVDASSDKTDKAKEARTLLKIDCQKRQRAALYVVEYFRSGASQSGELSGDWSPIIPGTIADGEMRFLCERLRGGQNEN